MHCSSKSAGFSSRSSSEAESSGKISAGSGSAGGDLISIEISKSATVAMTVYE